MTQRGPGSVLPGGGLPSGSSGCSLGRGALDIFLRSVSD